MTQKKKTETKTEMTYIITNKRGGNKKVWSVSKGCIVLEFDKNNIAKTSDSDLANRLKALGYGVKEVSADA